LLVAGGTTDWRSLAAQGAKWPVCALSPKREGANPSGLAKRIRTLQESLDFPQVEKRKPAAGALFDVCAVGLKLMHPQRFSVVEPHFGHSDVQ